MRTLLEQQLEAHNEKIALLWLEQQQMFDKVMAILQEESMNELIVNTPNSKGHILNFELDWVRGECIYI